MIDRRHRDLTNEDIAKIAATYHAWRGETPSSSKGKGKKYSDIQGFCKVATLDEIRKHGHTLTPGRYVGTEVLEEDGEVFDEKMKRLTTELGGQFKRSAQHEVEIKKNLKELGYQLPT